MSLQCTATTNIYRHDYCSDSFLEGTLVRAASQLRAGSFMFVVSHVHVMCSAQWLNSHLFDAFTSRYSNKVW
jgi:hypothetical protein